MYYGNPLTNLKELEKHASEIMKGENGTLQDDVMIHHHKAEVACNLQLYKHNFYMIEKDVTNETTA